jgi:hypothetical protein
MQERAERTGRHAADDAPAEAVAIIGGSVVTALAGRIRRPHTVADIETQTAELPIVLPSPRRPPAGLPPVAAVRARGRRVARPLLVAVAIAALVGAVTAVLVLRAAPATPTVAVEHPAAPTPTSAPVVLGSAASGDGPALLAALRRADLPVSRSGRAETEAAAAICAQLRRGADLAQLARAVPAMLPDVSRQRAPMIVDMARRYYCP